jgi:hypothetical protein
MDHGAAVPIIKEHYPTQKFKSFPSSAPVGSQTWVVDVEPPCRSSPVVMREEDAVKSFSWTGQSSFSTTNLSSNPIRFSSNFESLPSDPLKFVAGGEGGREKRSFNEFI